MEITAAVIVTSPQRLSFIDVIKGIEMFDELNVPTVSVIQNFAYYKCSECSEPKRIFGPGYMNQITELFGIKNSIEIPIDDSISQLSDQGAPIVDVLPDSAELTRMFLNAGQGIIDELDTLTKDTPKVGYLPSEGNVIITTGNEEKRISAYELRMKCMCAL